MALFNKENKKPYLPCPFCGSTNTIWHKQVKDMQGQITGQRYCHNCGARGPEALEQLEKKIWNERS